MKQLREFTGHIYESIMEKGPIDPPAMLTLHRKNVRVFPDGTKVATYYSDALKKTFTLPFGDLQMEATKPTKKPVKEKLPKDEDDPEAFSADNLATLKNIVSKNKGDTLEFADGSELDVEPATANAIMAMFARCSKENKDKIELMLTKGVNTFMRLSKLAMST